MGYRKLRTMGVREVCGREIVFKRQICKPPEQLVSSFHSDKGGKKNTVPKVAYVCLLLRRVRSTNGCFAANIFVSYWILA